MGENKIRAIFLDRDGVINHNVFYPDSQEWESPRSFEEFEFIDGAIDCLKKLQTTGYLLFIATNQPSYAKGKTSLENLENIIKNCEKILANNGINITKTYCSFNHPKSIYPDYGKYCKYRKPEIGALVEAKQEFNIDMSNSWMIGDRETDIICGNTAGVKTIRVMPDYHDGEIIIDNKANFSMRNINEASQIIINEFCNQ